MYKRQVLLEDADYTLNVIPGSGPRHMIFSYDGRFAYLVNEIANNIMVFKYSAVSYTHLDVYKRQSSTSLSLFIVSLIHLIVNLIHTPCSLRTL